MKRDRITSLFCWLLLCAAPPLLGQCGGATEEPGTETGNPSRIEARKLYLVESTLGVQLIGDEGAVAPGGATVRVTNVRTGESVEVASLNDGSVNVVVPGTLADGYEIVVLTSGGGTSAPVSVPAREETNPLAALSCNALENALGQGVATSFGAADTDCTLDSDCVYAGWGVGCYYQCGGSVISVAGQSAAVSVGEEATSPICAELEGRCERQPASSCPPSPATVPACVAGTCQGVEVNQLECTDLSSQASERLREHLDQADRTCSADSDCERINRSVSCFADCGNERSVAGSAVTALDANVALVERDFCEPFANRACPPPIALPCLPPFEGVASCNAGQCDIAFAAPPDF